MKKSFLFPVALLLVSLNAPPVVAQSTFSRVHQILQANCTSSGCHGSDNTQVFDLSGSQTDMYNALVDVAAINEIAASKNNKIVAPGYPTRSFLMKKIINGLGADLVLETGEGNACPQNLPALANAEIELVRQWIMFGAPQSGQVVSEQLLIDFYDGNALPQIEAPPAPPAGQGFQIHDGPIFLAPGDEKEFQWKYNTELPEAIEVTRVEAKMSPQSHHYIVYKYNVGHGSTVDEGHVVISSILGQADVQLNGSMIATWQYNRDHELPAGTAYFWEAGAAMNSNFHIRNYDNDSILAAHSYLNVYTQPQGSGAVEMFSELAPYGGLFNPFALNVPNSGTTVLSFDQTENEMWHFWILQGHTHKLGKDYDIFLRNSNGSRGDKIYEGFFNYEDGFNQGFYDFAHPPVLEFAPMRAIDMSNGLIHEATYENNGPSDVGFGITTADEMFITYMHYTKETPTAIRSVTENSGALHVYPNPSSGNFNVSYSLPQSGNVLIELYNVLGERVAVLKNENQLKGNYTEQISVKDLNTGVCLVRVNSKDFSATRKIIVE